MDGKLRAVAQVYFGIVGIIGLITGAVLIALPASTESYFAWPIAPAQTALFMGAGYLGTGLTLLGILAFGRSWSDARLIVPPVAIFAFTMIGATLLHRDRFFWDRIVTWLWLGLYFVILAGAAGVELAHRHAATDDPIIAMTRWERAALVTVGILTAAWAVPLYVAPAVASSLWPWTLSPLTSRVVAGWIAVAAALALTGGLLNDARSLRLPLLGWLITVLAFLVTSAASMPKASRAGMLASVYFAALGFFVLGSLWLLARIRRRLPH
ncbi:MAG TPA: hypothetical protein VFC51_11435 [Chloroflexota bacterium]|nr:hypothetical protein [Chloroflexota bacterium]